MKARVISGIVIAVLTIGLGIYGGVPLGAVLMVCAMIAYYELTRALGVHEGAKERFNALEVTGEVITALYYVLLMYVSVTQVELTTVGNYLIRGTDDAVPFIQSANSLAIVAIIAVFLVNMTIYVLTYPRFEMEQVLGSIFSFIYAPIMISCIYRSEFLPYGIFVYALIFFCSWINDTCAYLAGRAFGKHKMTPKLSPNKTIEGAIGGILGSIVLCVAAAGVIEYMAPGANVFFSFGVIGFFGSLVGIVGDLAASAIKRSRGIKDYGYSIPGHGGIMDRFDSVIFTAPAIYILGMFFLAAQ